MISRTAARATRATHPSCRSVIAYDPADHPHLVERLTVDAVQAHLKGIVQGEIKRYELDHLHALQFVCSHALAGGVTTSLALDSHGKSLSYALLSIEV